MAIRKKIWIALLALAGGFGLAESACAGWITVKNDTKQVIVIQDVGGPLNKPIRGKSIKLQPGETYREFQLLAGSKNIVIYDSDKPDNPLTRDKMAWAKDDATFAVKADGKAMKLVTDDESMKVKK